MVGQKPRVSLLPFPRDDDAFVQRAKALLDSLDGGPDAAHRLEALLRAEYANAIVQPRDGLGALDRSVEAWYVYRDGSPTFKAHADDATGEHDRHLTTQDGFSISQA
jgi:hypothetical protein